MIFFSQNGHPLSSFAFDIALDFVEMSNVVGSSPGRYFSPAVIITCWLNRCLGLKSVRTTMGEPYKTVVSCEI